MPSPRTSSLLRFFKKLVGYLILAAILQYAVAAACGLSASLTSMGRQWRLTVDHNRWTCDLEILQFHSTVFDVLDVLCSRGTEVVFPSPNWNSEPDWTMGDWVEYDERASPLPDSHTQPPAWSHFSRIAEEPMSGIAAQSLWGEHIEWGCGWPMRSATCRISESISGVVVHDAFVMNATSRNPPRVIPLGIYWPGAIVNTLTYAALLAIPFILAPLLRGHLRRRAGHCPNCNYDLRATTTGACPECGRTTPGDHCR